MSEQKIKRYNVTPWTDVNGSALYSLDEAEDGDFAKAEDLTRVESERDRYREALEQAIEGLEDMICYVPEFFRNKWDHQSYIDQAKAALHPPASEEKKHG